jgi:hypothetical protein
MTSIASAKVARTIGIKTATLAKWRRENRGPRSWLHLSSTFVVYPEEEVEVYLIAMRAAEFHRLVFRDADGQESAGLRVVSNALVTSASPRPH